MLVWTVVQTIGQLRVPACLHRGPAAALGATQVDVVIVDGESQSHYQCHSQEACQSASHNEAYVICGGRWEVLERSCHYVGQATTGIATIIVQCNHSKRISHITYVGRKHMRCYLILAMKYL